ncbi:MAG: radical SAM protein [Proteobacteria bacterium]|nr:radical SAM protein [Pseudomonadota bacterium]NIS69732.1 radical SAM protein [Pseudomonadota bacterium]
MEYEGAIYRPPSEAESLILQATVGCSHNRCIFCGSYKNKRFRIRSFDEIRHDIDEASSWGVEIRRVFLADGDALFMPQKRLLEILFYLRDKLGELRRVGIYGNARSILHKTARDLTELREAGLGIVYLGIESGNRRVLEKIKKGATYEEMVAAGRRVKEADISLSVTVLLGIGGTELSHQHAMDTGRILGEIDPDFVGALTLMVVPGTPLERETASGAFELPDPFALLEELGIMIGNCELSKCLFTSNHPSNYLPLKISMPGEREKALQTIQRVLTSRNRSLLRPESLRAL